MSTWFQFGSLYIVTFVDFWRLRPRKFLCRKEHQPNQYMLPAQFWLASATLMFTLDIASYSFPEYRHAMSYDSATFNEGSAFGLAVQSIVFLIFIQLVSCLFYFLSSRVWPIKGRPHFSDLLDMQFYLIAIRLPAAAAITMLAPAFGRVLSDSAQPTAAMYILATVLFSYLILTWLFWSCPFVAVLNRVSTPRAIFGTFICGIVFYPMLMILFAMVSQPFMSGN